MKTLSSVKNKLIDKIMLTDNEQLLEAIDNILSATQKADTLKLDSDQIEMLQLSETDILNGDLISESELRKTDSKWMD